MNLRLESSSVRFRIAADELAALIRGQTLEQTLQIGPVCWQWSIVPTSHGSIALQAEGSALTLLTPQHELQALHNMGMSKHGLERQQGALSLSLQVDLW